MKQQELIDLLNSWGFKEVAFMHFVLDDKIAKYRVIITPYHIDFTVFTSYLGKEFNSFERQPIEALEMIAPDYVLCILKDRLFKAMSNLLKHYISNSFLKELQ